MFATWLRALLTLLALTGPAFPQDQPPDEFAAATALLDESQQLMGSEPTQARARVVSAMELLLAREDSADDPQAVELLWLAGQLAYALRDLEAAQGCFEVVLAYRERTLTSKDGPLLAVRGNLAFLLLEQGRPDAAVPLLERVLADYISLRGETSPSVLMLRQRLGLALNQLRRFTEAHDQLMRVLAVLEEQAAPEDEGLLVARQNLGFTLLGLGRLEQARTLFADLLALRQEASPPNPLRLAEAHHNLATALMQSGETRAALAQERAALATFEAELAQDHPSLLLARQNLAGMLDTLGHSAEARRMLEQLHDGYLQSETDPQTLASVERNLGRALWSLGDLWRARALTQSALRRYRSAGVQPSDVELLTLRQNLASIEWDLGDREGSLAALEQICQEMEALAPTHPSRLSARGNLAQALSAKGDVNRALSIWRELVDTYAEHFPAANRQALAARLNLAATLQGLDRARESIAPLELGLAEALATFPPDDPLVIRMGLGLAHGRLLLGEFEAAQPLARLALDQLADFPDDHPLLELARHELIWAHLGQGQFEVARELAEAMVNGVLERLRRASGAVPNRQREALASTGAAAIHSVLSAGDALLPPARQLELLVALRGFAEREARALEIVRARARTDRDLERALDGALVAQRQLAQARGPAIAPARAAMERAQESLAARTGELPQVRELFRVSPLADLRSKLGRNEQAVVTAHTEPAFGPGEPQVCAFVLSKTGPVVRVELGSAREIEAACAAYRAELARGVGPTRGPRDVRLPQSASAAPALAQRLTPLFEALGPGPHDLSICPDRALASIPWGPLFDGKRLRYLENLTALRERAPLEGPPSLLTCGGIEYGAAEPALPPLPGSLAEVRVVGAVFKERFPGATRTELSGAAATPAAFRAAAAAGRVIHIATHSFVASPTRWQALERSAGSPQQEPSRLFPGLLSGLAFAGVDRDQGLMTGLELASLDLAGCELAVLSSCDSNVGPRYFGQALAGLNRSLQLAGARNTITSLWKVSDGGAARFFELFYGAWLGEQRGLVEAFQLAKRRAREAGLGPDVWAAFVLYTTGPG
jgi:tetratricopeptide (TPR) repeat protein